MREIKFRAWYKEKKVMIGDIQDDLTCNLAWYSKQFILMQYTGLHDTSDREIYEGDIVKATGSLQGFVMCVVWGKMDAGWRVNYHNGRDVQDWLCMYKRVELIGNIYENPELLGRQV